MRKSLTVTIPHARRFARDVGKVFVITEMAASRGEAWAMRCFLAMAAGGMDIPEDLMGSGMQGLAVFGLRAIGGMRFIDAEPLLAEMMTCVQHIPNPQKPVPRHLVDNGTEGDDIEEISTRLHLRQEIFKLHADFFEPAAESTSTSRATGSDTRAT